MKRKVRSQSSLWFYKINQLQYTWMIWQLKCGRGEKSRQRKGGRLRVASAVRRTQVMWSDLGFVERGQTWLVLLRESVFATLELSPGWKDNERGEREAEFRQRDENHLDLWHRWTEGRAIREQGAKWGGIKKNVWLAFSLWQLHSQSRSHPIRVVLKPTGGKRKRSQFILTPADRVYKLIFASSADSIIYGISAYLDLVGRRGWKRIRYNFLWMSMNH